MQQLFHQTLNPLSHPTSHAVSENATALATQMPTLHGFPGEEVGSDEGNETPTQPHCKGIIVHACASSRLGHWTLDILLRIWERLDKLAAQSDASLRLTGLIRT